MWNPKEHEGIEVLRVPSGRMWLPDIVLYNNNDGVFDVALQVHVQVYSSGRVTWTPPALYCSSCGVKVTYFPFDWQNCTMQFRSYTYDSTEVDLQHTLDAKGKEIREVLLDEGFSESGEWYIRHKPSRKNMNEDLYDDITFYLIIEREKMGLSINVLLTITVFLLLLADKVPETSLAVPIIVNYIMFTMILVTCSVILSVVIFIHLLPPYLGMLRPKVETPLSLETPVRRENVKTVSRSADEYFIRKPTNSFLFPNPNRYQPEGMTTDMRKFIEGPSSYLTLPDELKSAIEAINYIAEALQAEKDYEALKEDWQYVAMVVDRMFLWIFVVFTTLGTLGLFADAGTSHTPTDPFPPFKP
ncbi:hypothetical protein NHX12_013600 [Muraenolepis orangiensis]|uniref:Neurotransmitter-gated ion-channel ligand-binding domain-containing protein n=1 Tax=Muraenolepis orangiensis TaxID=630683 RepID=A0A9Q0I2Z3_9TELE|nr:hypothetical protein NHX12_013600 [Muraenolepis orangiensis]